MNFKKLILVSFVSLLATGCASSGIYKSQSYIENPKINTEIAKVTAEEVKKSNPDQVSMIVKDDFGVALLHSMKQNQIKVEEVDLKNKEVKPNFVYYADSLGLEDKTVYRVGFNYKSASYSRMFQEDSGMIVPVTNWSVRTGGAINE